VVFLKDWSLDQYFLMYTLDLMKIIERHGLTVTTSFPDNTQVTVDVQPVELTLQPVSCRAKMNS